MEKRLIGKGIFGWCNTERRTQRYGSIHLADSPYEGAARAAIFYDEEILARWQGERVRLTVRVVESRPSTHAGDHALGIVPEQPAVGEGVDLGVGRLGAELGYDGNPDILLVPEDSRACFWIDPRSLYRLHDQTVEVYAEQTTDPPSPVPEFEPVREKHAYDNGDGSLQVVGAALGETIRVRLRPRIVRLENGLSSIDFELPGAGREFEIETE